jgi:LacI family transcriptional regulator
LFECLDTQIRALEQVPYLALSHCVIEKERELLRHWASGEVDAIIVDPLGNTENENLISTLQSWALPVMTLHTNIDGKFDSQVYDSRQPLQRAMQYLVQLGHRHIGYIGYESVHARETSYYHEYIQFMSEAGLPVRPEDTFFVSNDSEAGRETLIHWPSKLTRPTALICFNDSIALSLLTQLNALNLRVPEDISILGRDDVQVSACVGLSTLRTDRRITAKKIVETLQARITTPDRPIDSIVIPSELVMRRSLGRVPSPPP